MSMHQIQSSSSMSATTRFHDLEPAEQFLMGAYRHWLTGLCRDCSVPLSIVWSDFSRRFGGADGKRALEGLEGIVRTILNGARRPIHYHQLGCPCVHPDEVAILGIVGAGQQHQIARARFLASKLVDSSAAADLWTHGRTLGEVFGQYGFVLPCRELPEFAVRDSDADNFANSRTIH